MKVRAGKGRYFSVGDAEAWREARRLSLVEDQLAGKARVELRNPHAATDDAILLVELVGRLRLTIYSLPQTIERAFGEQAIRRALQLCALHRHRLAPANRLKRSALVVYLEGPDKLRLIERVARYQERKYRSASKFSTAFKLKKTRVEQRHVGTYEL